MRNEKKWGDETQDKRKIGRQDARQKNGEMRRETKKNRETRHETKTTGRQEARQKKGR